MLLLVVLVALNTAGAQNQRQRRILVRDGAQEPLIGASVVYGREKGFATGLDGRGVFPLNLSDTTMVRVSFVGYKPYEFTLGAHPHKNGLYTVDMQEEATTLLCCPYIIVRRSNSSIGTAFGQLSSGEIQRQIGRSLAEVLEKFSGISSIKSGTGAAKPVIHGMHGNRILIVNNGVRQSGQQWGESHAPEVDLSASHTIRVVKGAEGVRYGSEAMGGVIIMEQRELPYYTGHATSGRLSSSYSTNGHAIVNALQMEGRLQRRYPIAWRIHGMHANSGDKSTANYLLNNTGEKELNLSAALGLDFGIGRIEALYSRYDSRHGIMRSAQLGSVHIFRERIRMGRPHEETITPFSRDIQYPYEHVVHHTGTLRARWEDDRYGKLSYQLSLQQDNRQEFRIRRINSAVPEVDLSLSSLQNRLQWEKSYAGVWSSELGAQYISTENYSVPGTGVAAAIPNYTEQMWGVYGRQEYLGQKLSAEAGIRIDGQNTNAAGYSIFGEYYGGKRKFTNISYTLGASYQLTNSLRMSSNFGAAWRAPHVRELYAGGSDHGSAAFIRGDSTLRSEQSYKWVSSLAYHHGKTHITLDGYLQWINNYIYDEPQMQPDGTPELITLISGAYPIFQFKQTQALLRGIDLSLDLELPYALRYTLSTALIYANERTTNAYLPYIPPMRIDHELKWANKVGRALSLEFGIGHRYVAKQTRFEPSRDLIPFTPAAYHLVSAHAELKWQLKHNKALTLSLDGNNLLDREYKEYTNRARYYSHELGRDIRLGLALQF